MAQVQGRASRIVQAYGSQIVFQMENKLKRYNEPDVIALINECMANNWKGIIWDKIKSRASPHNTPSQYEGICEVL